MARESRELRAATSSRPESEDTVLRAEVAEALATLDVRQRAVVFLTYWEDLDATDIADRLDISLRTVRRDLAAAKQKLKGHLHD
ncbi:MAG: sigma-70 family RNA polymerase sigma factor [Actinomycetota bacterium]|nr:sigma-70 family RNA polymerase sigma factor [Actinomycetota bacterium]